MIFNQSQEALRALRYPTTNEKGRHSVFAWGWHGAVTAIKPIGDGDFSSNHKKPYVTQQPMKKGVTLFLPEGETVLSQQYSQ